MRHRWPLTREFTRDQAALTAYNQRRLGLREVPVAVITGSVGRAALGQRRRQAAWRKTARYAAIKHALAADQGLPPVTLYLLDGHYYIFDGHHRVAAAHELGMLELDAEVTEFLPGTTAAAMWHRARASFERDTSLTGLHVRQAAGYDRLRAQIAEHAWYRGERGQAPGSFTEAATRWYRDIYWPVLTVLGARGVLARTPALTQAEVYLAVCEHKWYCSERQGQDVGFSVAMASFAREQRWPWLARLRRWLEDCLPWTAGGARRAQPACRSTCTE